MFEATRQLFARWLYYGIATMFTMSVLSFMVAVAMKMVLAVASIFAAQYGLAMAAGVPPQGISSMALQQGGLGLILTILLVSTPPMAGAFFQGTLGQFSAYNQFGGAGGAPPGAAGPGSGPTVSGAQLASPTTVQSVSHAGAMTRPQGADAGPFVDEIRPASRPTPVG